MAAVSSNDLLIQLPYLETNDGLEKASPVVAARKICMLQHLLRHLSIVLRRQVAQMALNIYQLI